MAVGGLSLSGSATAACGAPLRVRADNAGLTALQEHATAWLEGAGVGFAATQRILLALDELAANVRDHGTRKGDAPASIELGLARDGEAIDVGFSDDGPAFDPADVPPPAAASRLEDVSIGGFGLHLVRQLAQTFEYRRDGTWNRVRLRFADAGA